MPTLAELASDRATAKVDWYGHTITVAYRPNAYTYAVAARVAEMPVNEVFDLLVESWDLTGADGEPVPFDDPLVPNGLRPKVVIAVILAANSGEAESS